MANEEKEVTIVIRGKNLTPEAFAAARKQVAGLKNDSDQAAASGSSLGNAFKVAAGAVGGFFTAQAIMNGVGAAFSFAKGAAFDMNATLEKSTLQFATLMGDTKRAEQHVRDLFQFAKATPFETGPIIEASRHMQTFGGDALNTMDNLGLLGDAAAATGAPIDQLGFWVGRMYAAMKGGQPFGEATMRLMEMGVITPQIRSQMEGLAQTAGGGEKAFSLFKDSLGGFSGAMVAQANTWEGLMSSISDAINITLADALKPFFDTAKEGAQMLLAVLGSDGTQRVFEEMKTSISGAFGGGSQGLVKSLAAGLLTFASAGVTVAEGIHRAFSLVKMVFAGTASAFGSLMLAVTSGITEQLQMATKIPGIGKSFQGVADEARLMHAAMVTSQKGFHDMAAEAWEGVKGNSAFATVAASTRTAIEGMRGELAKATVATEAADSATKRHATSQQQFVALSKEEEKALKAKEAAAKKFADSVSINHTMEWWVGFKKPVSELSRELEELPASSDIAMRGLTRFKDAVRATGTDVDGLGDSIREGLSGVLATIPGTLARAFEGGGSWMGAFKSIGSQAGSAIGQSIGESFKALGALGGPLGSALGSLVGPLIGKIGSLFTSKNTAEVKAYNVEIGKVFSTLYETYGTLDELEAKAQSVGLSFKDNIGHQGKAGLEAVNSLAAEFKRRWDGVNKSLAASRGELAGLIQQGADLGYNFDASGNLIGVNFDKMREMAQKYGVDLAALGPSFDQAQLRTRIGDVINGFELMDQGGVTTGTILAGMKDEINQIVNDSIKFGVDIPENMKPWIENLIETGQLTDDNGVKITDLAAIQFGAPMATQFETITTKIGEMIAKIGELVDRLATALTPAIDNATRDRTINIGFSVDEIPDIDIGSRGSGESSPRFARGTYGTLGIDFPDFGSGTRAILDNREAVVPYEERFAFAERVLAGAGGSSAAAGPTNLYLSIDPSSGRVRQLGEAERSQVQGWLYAGQLDVPQRIVSGKGR